MPALGTCGVLPEGAWVERLLADGYPTEDITVLKDERTFVAMIKGW